MLILPIEQYATRAFPWVPSFKKALLALNVGKFRGSDVFVGSDYSGSHKGSDFLTYAFFLVDAEGSRDWARRRNNVRAQFLRDGRRMSFKRLNDASRRSALLPFLNAADHLSGVLAVVLVHKSIGRITTGTNTLAIWRLLQGLAGKWTPQAFETMVRIAR